MVDGYGAKLLSFTYSTTGSKIGLMSKYVRSNGQVVTFSHDNRRRPSRSTYPNTDLGYKFNARGNLDNYYNYKDGTKNKSFGYDALNRLTTFNGPWGNGSYQYNASGDRIQKKIGSKTTCYSYINHLLSGGNYSFNADGDMTRDGDISFEYDRFHNVKRAIKSSSPLATYGYDSSKQRVYKIAGDSTTLYFNDFRGNTHSELTGDGTPLENYICLGDRLISKVSYNRLGDVFRNGTRDLMDVILGPSVVNGETPDKPLFLASDVGGDKTIGLDETIYDLGVVSGLNPNSESEVFFYDTDYLGTSITLSDASGNVVWQVDELPFGEEYEQDGIPDINKRRYIGKEKDVETGLLYFGARYLNASDGRFISADPVGLVDTNGKVNPDILSDPQRLNRYAYGLNNPYRYVDPDGRDAIELNIKNGKGSFNYLNDDGKVVFSAPANSGRGAGLNNPKMQDVADFGPTPEGSYSVDLSNGAKPDKTVADGYGWGSYGWRLKESTWTKVKRKLFTDRDGGFYIHQDEYRGNQTGTAGCFGVLGDKNITKVKELLQNYSKDNKKIKVKVKYKK